MGVLVDPKHVGSIAVCIRNDLQLENAAAAGAAVAVEPLAIQVNKPFIGRGLRHQPLADGDKLCAGVTAV